MFYDVKNYAVANQIQILPKLNITDLFLKFLFT